jgi:glyoxylase-like metal-dependent hydrolase (beta-lactamase superfamily II)
MSTIIDLQFQGRSHVIAAAILSGRDGLALVDPGPSSCLAALEEGLSRHGARLEDVRQILLTHIHLDHAGASGTIARRLPETRVWVHELGARHMVDPSRLLASARRLYGDEMDTLWGPMLPVPAERVHVLHGGERVSVGERQLGVTYTPGHAVHHVTYLDETDGTAYVGDTAGVRIATGHLAAPTPPPDIDLEAWAASLDRIDALSPRELLLTHFGAVDTPREHLARFRDVLARSAEAVRATLSLAGSDEEKILRFSDDMRAHLRRTLSEEDASAAELAAPFATLWLGLARYWRRKSGRT